MCANVLTFRKENAQVFCSKSFALLFIYIMMLKKSKLDTHKENAQFIIVIVRISGKYHIVSGCLSLLLRKMKIALKILYLLCQNYLYYICILEINKESSISNIQLKLIFTNKCYCYLKLLYHKIFSKKSNSSNLNEMKIDFMSPQMFVLL